jgi:hypothetical protein
VRLLVPVTFLAHVPPHLTAHGALVPADDPGDLVVALSGLPQNVNLATLYLGHARVRHLVSFLVHHKKEVYFTAWPFSKHQVLHWPVARANGGLTFAGAQEYNRTYKVNVRGPGFPI